ncbi:MAG: gliding motility-associated C-terminal domain-containing protein [Chitinophagaceae bacterium]
MIYISETELPLVKYPACIYFICLAFLSGFLFFESKAQTTNPCGVIASIWPAAADSVVPLYTVIPFTSTSINATSVQWLYDGMNSGITSPTWNYSIGTGVHTLSLVAYNGNCSDTATVVYFSAGTPHDIDSLLVANYGHVDTHEYGTCLDDSPDGGFILGGYGVELGCGETGLIVKLRDKGCIDWSKEIKGSYNCDGIRVTSIYASADTNYYAAGNNGRFLMKLDRNGNVLWNKRLAIQGLQGSYTAHDIITGDPGGYIYSVSRSLDFGWTVTKLDPSGNVVWNKYYQLGYFNPADPGPYDYTEPTGILWLNGKLFISGNALKKSNVQYFNFVTRIDAANGQTDWQYGYLNGIINSTMNFDHLSAYNNLLMVASSGIGENVTLIDQQGNVRKSIKAQFTSSYAPRSTRAEADINGNIFLMQWTEQTLPLQPYFAYHTNFARIDTSLNKYWGMVYTTYPRGYFTDAALGKNKFFAAVGMDFGYVTNGQIASRDFRFIKVDTPIVSTDLNCNYNTLDYNLSTEVINRINFQWITDSSLTLNSLPETTISVNDAYMQSRYSCPDFIDSCSFMKITGPLSMCNYANTYTYRLHKNKKCALAPVWTMPPGVTKISQTDSTLSVKFSGYGNYKIAAFLKSCIPVKDSLIITIAPKTSVLNLGNDTSLCNNTNLTLHAGPSFMTYLWKDGSTDSVFTASQAGIYWVQVTDSCGNNLRDSITVNTSNLAINIGPDRTICSNDTLHLNAPGGFLSYAWSNNYNINSTTSQNVIVNPLVDTAYYFKAEKSPGCFVYDTIRVVVFKSPLIDIGKDTSMCVGGSILFDAGNSFASYQWSNGVSTQQISVNNIGTYSVIGTTSDGCKRYDTVKVLNIWPLPLVNISGRSTICFGSTTTLDAGSFQTPVFYLWSNGSNTRTIDVKDIGAYSIEVTNNNGCIGKDTITINTILPSPSGFLPPDTAICPYEKLELLPMKSFSSYLWSNNASAKSIFITEAGQYWLQAKDNNNCIGKDTIIVNKKECLNGLFVPTAFTPNDDGKNDIFKALLFGNIQSFELTVYNRWGQIVFQTKDPLKGWDGKIANQKQNTAVFIWLCRYQLNGEMQKLERGHVTLIH